VPSGIKTPTLSTSVASVESVESVASVGTVADVRDILHLLQLIVCGLESGDRLKSLVRFQFENSNCVLKILGFYAGMPFPIQF